MSLTIVKVAEHGAQRAGTFLVGPDGKSGYFTHDRDPGFGPMGHRDSVAVLPFVCGTDPQHVAQARWMSSSPLHYSATCTCGWGTGEPSRTALDQLVAHAAPV